MFMNERAQSYLDFAVKVFIVDFAVFLVSYAPLFPIFRKKQKFSSFFVVDPYCQPCLIMHGCNKHDQVDHFRRKL